jgi:hypothetical protein
MAGAKNGFGTCQKIGSIPVYDDDDDDGEMVKTRPLVGAQ